MRGNFALTCGDVKTDPRSSYAHGYRQGRPSVPEIRTLEVDRAMGDVTAAPKLSCENRGRPGCMGGGRRRCGGAEGGMLRGLWRSGNSGG